MPARACRFESDFGHKFSRIAQLVEHRFYIATVGGSNPSAATMIDQVLQSLLAKVGSTQMTEAEYYYVASLMGGKNVLVFGTGHDSQLWRIANEDGLTVFLENDPKWITSPDVVEVRYTTVLTDADRLLAEYAAGIYDGLVLGLPDQITAQTWDVIFVDSPTGYAPHTPGRMQSLYAASVLAGVDTDVLIHDCDRRVEDLYSRAMFSRHLTQLTKLRHCRK